MSNKLIEKCEGAEVALFNLVLFDFLLFALELHVFLFRRKRSL